MGRVSLTKRWEWRVAVRESHKFFLPITSRVDCNVVARRHTHTHWQHTTTSSDRTSQQKARDKHLFDLAVVSCLYFPSEAVRTVHLVLAVYTPPSNFIPSLKFTTHCSLRQFSSSKITHPVQPRLSHQQQRIWRATSAQAVKPPSDLLVVAPDLYEPKGFATLPV
jgi:hypothetical protein